MKTQFTSTHTRTLIIGDAVVLVLLTIYGFIDHQTLASAGSRFWITLIGHWVAWLLVSPWFGLYTTEIVPAWKQQWRVVYAAALAAPLAVTVRALFLGRPVEAIFVVVLAAVSALGLLLWRAGFAWWVGRK